jgi:hypothetical protein
MTASARIGRPDSRVLRQTVTLFARLGFRVDVCQSRTELCTDDILWTIPAHREQDRQALGRADR